MKPALKHCGLAVSLLLAGGPATQAASEKPNFIVINIDDLGYGDIGPFGSQLNRTPNLDRMAGEGRKLTSFYAAPVCSPSRAALMTGCYPKRVLPLKGVLFPSAALGLNPEEHTVAELLKQAGYATACIGKWHLGDQPEFLPRRHGFDYFLGTPYSNDMGPAEDGAKSSLGDPLPKPKKVKSKGEGTPVVKIGLGGAFQPPLPLVENETVIARVGPDEQQGIVERYTEAAVKFITENRDKPFFLYMPHNAIHFPFYPGKKFHQQSANGIYGDWVEEVDGSVGRVLDTVRELKLEGRTIVVFTSDNGGSKLGLNTPLRGHKGSTWEGGIRVPTIAWCPGKIPAGTETDAITGMFDILPTFVNLAGGKVPADRKIDGGDIWPVLTGKPGAKSPHEVFYYFRGLDLQAVRSGAWKLHLANNELYNLADDPGESLDVAAANPDEVSRLQAFVGPMNDDLGAKGRGPGVRPLGEVTDPQPLIGADGTIRPGFEPKE